LMSVFEVWHARTPHVLFVLFIPHTRNIFHLKLGTIIRAPAGSNDSYTYNKIDIVVCLSRRFTHAMCVHARTGQNLTTTTLENICYIFIIKDRYDVFRRM
jgi:hypothetical protein